MTAAADGAARRLAVGRVALLLAAAAALWFVGREAAAAVPRFAAWVDGLGAWGPAVFIAGYAVAVVAFVPGSLLTLAGGAIFGLFRGALYVYMAATLGSTLAFLVSRHLARGLVARRLESMPRFAAIDRAVASQGLRIVLLLRLSPAFPFTLLNYALGLTRVRLSHYVIASLGMIPGTFLYVYYGKVAGDVATLAAEGAPQEGGMARWVVLILGLLATLAVATLVARLARGVLRRETSGPI